VFSAGILKKSLDKIHDEAHDAEQKEAADDRHGPEMLWT